jgi:small GTP-binding protein
MPSDPSLPIAEVLRRCHRDELATLASVLKVNPAGLGRDKLARVLERALYAAGANRVENLLLRRGQGPDYARILAELAKRRGVAPALDMTGTELAVLGAWRDSGAVDRTQGATLALVLGPSNTAVATRPFRRRVKLPDLLVTLMMGLLWIFAPIVGPLAAIGLLVWVSQPRDEILLPAILQVALLREKVARRFTIGIVGPPSTGKDAALGAVFGVHTGNVHPASGSTREVAVYRLPGADGLQIVNTPGVGDVKEELTEETRAVLDQIDLFLFLVNAQGGVRTREKAEFQLCRMRRRPMLVVVNKIDTLMPSDRERFVEDVRSKLGVPPGAVVAAAFDPLPQLAPAPIGVEPVRAWLRSRLAEMGRDPSALPE